MNTDLQPRSSPAGDPSRKNNLTRYFAWRYSSISSPFFSGSPRRMRVRTGVPSRIFPPLFSFLKLLGRGGVSGGGSRAHPPFSCPDRLLSRPPCSTLRTFIENFSHQDAVKTGLHQEHIPREAHMNMYLYTVLCQRDSSSLSDCIVFLQQLLRGVAPAVREEQRFRFPRFVLSSPGRRSFCGPDTSGKPFARFSIRTRCSGQSLARSSLATIPPYEPVKKSGRKLM